MVNKLLDRLACGISPIQWRSWLRPSALSPLHLDSLLRVEQDCLFAVVIPDGGVIVGSGGSLLPLAKDPPVLAADEAHGDQLEEADEQKHNERDPMVRHAEVLQTFVNL